MQTWNPALYLKFKDERTQPARDLLATVDAENPRRVLDLGCGPGNSTILLAERWPDAIVTGIDSSAAMIRKARADYPADRFPKLHWTEKSADTDMADLGHFDVVFSNAVLHWIPDHDRLIPRLFALLGKDGILAVQVPNNTDSPLHTAVRDTARSAKWKDRLPSEPSFTYDPPETYYRQLAPLTPDVRLWQTVYYHLMASHQDIIDWSRGTYMRPYLDQLPDDATRQDFENDILATIIPAYPQQENGMILFAFRRLFFIARATG